MAVITARCYIIIHSQGASEGRKVTIDQEKDLALSIRINYLINKLQVCLECSF